MSDTDIGYQIAKDYTAQNLGGWLGTINPELVKAEFNLLLQAGLLKSQFKIFGQTRDLSSIKAMLYDVCRKVLGKDTPNTPQAIGDCVSFGAKNAGEYVTCTQILMGNLAEKWRPIFPPYYYGTGRVLIGKGQMGRQDGSSGAWMAAAVQKYGTLFADETGVPAYSGSIAKQWGMPNAGPILSNWEPTGQKYLIKSAALINSWDDLVAAVSNGYPCPTASNIGYDMQASSDGFFRQTQQWGHQMCFIGVDTTYKNGNEQYAIILNNWGDVHGHLKDFQDPTIELPVGVLRVRRADAEKHIAAGETFAYSNFDAFPEQLLDKALFNLG